MTKKTAVNLRMTYLPDDFFRGLQYIKADVLGKDKLFRLPCYLKRLALKEQAVRVANRIAGIRSFMKCLVCIITSLLFSVGYESIKYLCGIRSCGHISHISV